MVEKAAWLESERPESAPVRLTPLRTRTPPLSLCPRLLPYDPAPLSPHGRDPGAGVRTSTPLSVGPRRATRPDHRHPARRARSPAARAVPHDSLNTHLKHEILECNVRLK